MLKHLLQLDPLPQASYVYRKPDHLESTMPSVEGVKPQAATIGNIIDSKKLYEIQKMFRDRKARRKSPNRSPLDKQHEFGIAVKEEEFSPVEQLEKYIEENKVKSSVMVDRFPSIEHHKKYINEHPLPLTNMLSCESVFDFEKQTEHLSVMKKNKLLLENTIVSFELFIRYRLSGGRFSCQRGGSSLEKNKSINDLLGL